MRILLRVLRASFPSAAGFSSLILARFFSQNAGNQYALLLNILIALVCGFSIGLAIRTIVMPRDWKSELIFSTLSALVALVLVDALMPKAGIAPVFSLNTDWIQYVKQLLPLLGMSAGSAFLFTTVRGSSQVSRNITPEIPKLPIKNPRVESKKRIEKTITHGFKSTDPKVKSISTKPKHSVKTLKSKITRKPQILSDVVIVPNKKKRVRKKDIKLSNQIEQHCPYCLEIVLPGDPRGVVKCPDCGAWHHKDCWDVTGTCQVAHKHTL